MRVAVWHFGAQARVWGEKQSGRGYPSKLIDEKKVRLGIQQILNFQKMRIPATSWKIYLTEIFKIFPFGLVSFLVSEKIQIERIALFWKVSNS